MNGGSKREERDRFYLEVLNRLYRLYSLKEKNKKKTAEARKNSRLEPATTNKSRKKCKQISLAGLGVLPKLSTIIIAIVFARNGCLLVSFLSVRVRNNLKERENEPNRIELCVFCHHEL